MSKKYDILDITFICGDDGEPSILEWDIRVYHPLSFDCRILNFDLSLGADVVISSSDVVVRDEETYKKATEEQREIALDCLEKALTCNELTEQLKYLL